MNLACPLGIAALGLFLTNAPLISAADKLPPRPANILFLMADEYRHDCLGVAGHPIVRTPNFDKLAGEGVRFTQAYVASPVCSPSRATLFTGRYPQVHGVKMLLHRGDAILRDGNGLHRGTPNQSAEPRILLDQTYRAIED